MTAIMRRSSSPLRRCSAVAFLGLPLLSACITGPTGDPDGGNEPPDAQPCSFELLEAADIVGDALELQTGRSRTYAVTTDAPIDETFTLAVPEGVEAELSALEGGAGELTLWAGYAAADFELSISADCLASELLFDVAVTRPRWEQLPSWTPGENGPLGREYFSIWNDDTDEDRAFVFGGFHYVPMQFTVAWDLWSLDLIDGSWSELTPTGEVPMQAGGGFAPGPDPGIGVYFGGLAGDAEQGFSIPFLLTEVDYAQDPPTFRELTEVIGAAATGDYQPALLWDEPGGRYLSIGGQGQNGVHSDVHAFDPESSTWSSVMTTSENVFGVAGRTGFFWVHDAPRDRVVLFSGEMGGGAGGGCNCADDTWALELSEDPPHWVLLARGDESPPGRRNGAYAFDPPGDRMLVWGGTADGTSTSPGLWAFRLERGKEGWEEVVLDEGTAPAPRSSGGMIYDAPRDRMVVGFGNDSIVGAREDVWSLFFGP